MHDDKCMRLHVEQACPIRWQKVHADGHKGTGEKSVSWHRVESSAGNVHGVWPLLNLLPAVGFWGKVLGTGPRRGATPIRYAIRENAHMLLSGLSWQRGCAGPHWQGRELNSGRMWRAKLRIKGASPSDRVASSNYTRINTRRAVTRRVKAEAGMLGADCANRRPLTAVSITTPDTGEPRNLHGSPSPGLADTQTGIWRLGRPLVTLRPTPARI